MQLWWELPGPSGFLEEIVTAASEGLSVLIPWPPNAPSGLGEAAKDKFDAETSCRIEIFDVSTFGPEETPTIGLCQRLLGFGNLASGFNIRALVTASELEDCVIWIRGFTPSSYKRWELFLRNYIMERQKHQDFRSPVFCVQVPANSVIGIGEEFMKHTVWRNRVSRLDMTIYVGLKASTKNWTGLERHLLLAIVVELSIADPSLADNLLKAKETILYAPWELLNSYSNERLQSKTGWRFGTVQERDGETLEHSACLVARGKIYEVQRRIRRAQIAEILPVLEEIRLAFADHLAGILEVPFTLKYGAYEKRISYREDMEFGDIIHQVRGTGLPKSEWSLLNLCRRIRNQIAHGEIVPRSEVIELWEKWSAFRSHISENNVDIFSFLEFS